MVCTATYSFALPQSQENTVGDYTAKTWINKGIFKEIWQSAVGKKGKKKH